MGKYKQSGPDTWANHLTKSTANIPQMSNKQSEKSSSSIAPVVSPSSPKSSNSDLDDDEEYEYEEIEVEEEVEEEFDEEIDDEEAQIDEPEIGEDVREDDEEEELEDDNDAPIGDVLLPVAEEDQQIDANPTLETEEQKEHIRQEFVTSGTSASQPLKDKYENVSVLGVSDPPKSESAEVKETNPHAVEAKNGQKLPTTVVDDVKISPRVHNSLIRMRGSPSIAEFDGNKKQKIACEFYAKGWCIKGNSCRFLHVNEGSDATARGSEVAASSSAYISSKHIRESSKLNVETRELNILKGDAFGSDFLQAGRDLGKMPYADNYRNYVSPLMRSHSIDGNNTQYGNFSGSPIISDYHGNNPRISSSGTSLLEMMDNKHGMVLSDRRSSDLSFSHPRQPPSYALSPWNANTFGAHTFLDRNLDRRASISSSIQLGASSFSYYELGRLSRNLIHRDKEPVKYKTNISSYDWEPSLPFCPSHDITRKLLLKEIRHNPIHNDAEQNKVRGGLGKSSNSGQGSSMMNICMQSNNSEEAGELLTSVNVEDSKLVKTKEQSEQKVDSHKEQSDLKIDESCKNIATDVKVKKEGHLQDKEKALNHFQAALIEHVKDLVKPTWREGLMSKDAHKTIVRKSVDKVISTLQPEQVPSTPDSTKFYLTVYHSKLAKLVEGYIEKYGKS